MKTLQLGSSDLHVSPVCLGTMTFGEQVDEPTAHALLDRSLERGINFMDTADIFNALGTTLLPELLKQIDAIRWELRDPAL